MKKGNIISKLILIYAFALIVPKTQAQTSSSTTTSQLIDEMIKVTSSEDIHRVLSNLDQKALRFLSGDEGSPQMTDEEIITSSILGPVLKLRGILWRLSKLTREFPTIHIPVIIALRKWYSTFLIRPPHIAHWADHFSHPTSTSSQYQTISDLQKDYIDNLSGEFDESIKLLEIILERYKNHDGNPVLFHYDLALQFGYERAQNFIRPEVRFYPITLADAPSL